MGKIVTKIMMVLFVLTLVTVVGCKKEESGTTEKTETSSESSSSSSESSEAGKYKDGIYFAEEDGFSEKTGWKYCVTIEVKGGKITEAEWNGANKDGGTDKITRSESGEYGMVAKGDAQAEWHEQAAKAEAYLVEKQDPTAIEYSDDEGHTDAISGVSIHVIEFFSLAEKALNAGPKGYGMYKDGTYHAEQDEFSERTGWKSTVDVTVISGYIVAANWNAVHKDGGDDKKTQSVNGDYGMVENGDAQSEWHVQAAKAEEFLLEKQDPTAISYSDDEGHTDAISGVSIHVNDFFGLVEEALEGAKR